MIAVGVVLAYGAAWWFSRTVLVPPMPGGDLGMEVIRFALCTVLPAAMALFVGLVMMPILALIDWVVTGE